jgi:uncharacterized protein YqhQ
MVAIMIRKRSSVAKYRSRVQNSFLPYFLTSSFSARIFAVQQWVTAIESLVPFLRLIRSDVHNITVVAVINRLLDIFKHGMEHCDVNCALLDHTVWAEVP